MTTWILSLSSVAIVSLVSLLGLLSLSMNETRVRHLSLVLVSFAVGALLGDAFIHLIPATFQNGGSRMGSSLLILGGMLLFFIIEKLVRHRHVLPHLHHHLQESDNVGLAAINVIGDAIHNFIDGILIGASYLVSPTLGISTTIAVLFHEIPQELGDFGILVHSGLSARKAVLLNLASASFAILGTVLVLIAGSVAGEMMTSLLIPVTAGGFVYIALADLVPDLQHQKGLPALFTQAGLISLGILVMGMLVLFE